MCFVMFLCGGLVEEGQIGVGLGQFVGVKQVIGVGIVLIDGFFDYVQVQCVGIELFVFVCLCCNGGQVVDFGELYDVFFFVVVNIVFCLCFCYWCDDEFCVWYR